MRIEHLTSAESGWKAVFKEPDGSESLSRILGWAVLGGEDGEVTGVIVDPAEPSRIVPASGATSPGGGTFARYRFMQPEPTVVAAAPTPTPTPPKDSTEQLAKSLLKRRR